MKKSLILLFVLFLSTYFGFAQSGVSNSMLFQAGSGTLEMNELPAKKGETKGTFYYNENWLTGSLKLTTDETIADVPMKLNLLDKTIEIQTKDEIKVVNLYRVKNFTLSDGTNNQYFENSLGYINVNSEVNGVFEILVNGDTKLFLNPKVVLLPANYNEAVNAGSNNDKYTRSDKFYIYKNNELKVINNSKSSVLKNLEDKAEQIKTYSKENNLKFKEKEDLIKIVEYYNSIS